jgi:hypothetical protein
METKLIMNKRNAVIVTNRLNKALVKYLENVGYIVIIIIK